MDVSVLIPTYGRPQKVVSCVAALAVQTLGGGRYEVLVGIDGGEEDPVGSDRIERALRDRWPGARSGELTVVRCPKAGQAAVRNALLPSARGGTLVFLNDDTVPQPSLLGSHLRAQREAEQRGRPALVIGAAPWVVREPDSLFARLVRETSMVFFYDQMDAKLGAGEVGSDHDWGFRHAWLINLSAPARLVREAGAFTVFPETYGFEDDEFAFRCAQRFGAPVLYRPDAIAAHDHRMTPDDYLARERRLGLAARGFAAAAPECARAMFGRDITGEEELSYSREFVHRERSAAERARETLRRLDDLSPLLVPPHSSPEGAALITALYQQHLLLKRFEWRRGLIEAAVRPERAATLP